MNALLTWMSPSEWRAGGYEGPWYWEWYREPAHFYMRLLGFELSVWW